MKKLTLIFIAISFFQMSYAQEEKQSNWQIDGYVAGMNSVMFTDPHDWWQNDFLLHNRLNFNWATESNWRFQLAVRNRLMTGDWVSSYPSYDQLIKFDGGLVDLSRNIVNEKSVLLNTMVDRMWLEYQKGNWNLRIGRQRINWAKTFAWNPNDIFNTYSYFDFDYEEKPGSDAVLVQYWLNYASDIQLAAKVDKDNNLTTALKAAVNWKTYDFQVLAGMLSQTDWVLGFGWAGALWQIDFRGEISYFFPIDNTTLSQEMYLATTGLSYSFQNTLMLQLEGYYSSNNNAQTNLNNYLLEPISAKNMGLSRVSVLLAANYQLTPLWTAALSGMYFPEDKGFYFGPTFSFSMANNAQVSLVGQHFKLSDNHNGAKQQMTMAFLRIKYSF